MLMTQLSLRPTRTLLKPLADITSPLDINKFKNLIPTVTVNNWTIIKTSRWLVLGCLYLMYMIRSLLVFRP
jgi:hypothetical protein